MKSDWEIASDNRNDSDQSTLYDDLEKQAPVIRIHNPLEEPWDPNRSTAFLDGLRGLAAFLVMIYHINLAWYGEEILHGYGENGHKAFPLLPFVRTFYTGGVPAVAVFFVLSGFVLTISPLRKIRDRKAKQSLYKALISSIIRRPVRLFLPCLMFVICYAIARHTPMILEKTWPDLQGDVLLEVMTATSKFFEFFWPFRQHSVNFAYIYGVHLWTIPIELKGSMLVFGLTGLCIEGISPKRELLRLGLFGIMLHQMGQWAMSLFVFGMCLALCETYDMHLTDLPMFQHLSSGGRAKLNWFLFFLGWALSEQPERDIKWSEATPGWYLLTKLTPSVYLSDEYFRYWVGYGALLMVYSILRIQRLQQFFAWDTLTWLGKISFVLYLSHTVILMITGDRVKRVIGQEPWIKTDQLGDKWYDNRLYTADIGPMGLNIRWAAYLLLNVPFCLAFAHFTSDFYDQTGLRSAKWLTKRLGYDKAS